MIPAIKIEFTPQAQQKIAGFQKLPAQIIAAIARAMDLSNEFALGNIVEKHLTGRGPYPVEQHRLGERTHHLRNSPRRADAVVSGDKVSSSIGSNIIYAGIQEFGGRIHKKARSAKVRLRLDARGNLVRQLGHSHLAMFARKTHKHVREKTVTIGEHDINIPARAPFQTGIRETLPIYKKQISAAIISAWNDLKQ